MNSVQVLPNFQFAQKIPRSIADLIDDGTSEAQDTPISSIMSVVQREDLNNLADLSILMLGRFNQLAGLDKQIELIGTGFSLGPSFFLLEKLDGVGIEIEIF